MVIPPKLSETASADDFSLHHGHSETGAIAVDSAPVLASWELVVFGLICLADMASTAFMYVHKMADEANPLLAIWLHRSVAAFCVAKLVSFVPMLIVCTICRRRYPKLITYGIRTAIVIYVLVYAVGVGVQYIPQ
jgi:hypothetical protein